MLETYFNFLKKSLNTFSKNLVLFIPFILEVLVLIPIIALLLILEAGIFSLIFKMDLSAFNSPFAGYLVSLFFFIDVLIFIPIFAYFRAMKIGMYKEAILLKKTSSNFMFFYGKKFFKTKFRITLMVVAIFLVPYLFFNIITGLFYLISPTIGSVTAVVSGTLFMLYSLAAGIIVYFSLFFINPLIVSQDKSPLELIRMSINYARSNLSKVIITWAIILLVNIGVGIVLFILRMPYSLEILSYGALPIGLFLTIIQFLVQTGLTIVTDLFVFNVYFKLRK